MMFKKIVYQGMSLEDFTKYRNLLEINNIVYSTKVKTLDGTEGGGFSSFFESSRRSRGVLFTNHNYMKEYYIFVKKDVYDEAIHIINS